MIEQARVQSVSELSPLTEVEIVVRWQRPDLPNELTFAAVRHMVKTLAEQGTKRLTVYGEVGWWEYVYEYALKKGLQVVDLCDEFPDQRDIPVGVKTEFKRCPMALDIATVYGQYQFPCRTQLAHGGQPIGKVGPDLKQDRAKWYKLFNPQLDPICRKHCPAQCAQFNKAVRFRQFETEDEYKNALSEYADLLYAPPDSIAYLRKMELERLIDTWEALHDNYSVEVQV